MLCAYRGQYTPITENYNRGKKKFARKLKIFPVNEKINETAAYSNGNSV
jgi:hypothetical protein